MLTSIEGKTVLVTGASAGIGRGIASVFAKHGANVLAVARNEQALAETVQQKAGEHGFPKLRDISASERTPKSSLRPAPRASAQKGTR